MIALQLQRLLTDHVLVERDVDAALGIDALADRERQISRDKWLRIVQEHIERVLVRALPEQENIAEALGAEDTDLATLLLDDSICRDRGAMRKQTAVDHADVLHEALEIFLVVLGCDLQRAENSLRPVMRRRRGLEYLDVTRLIHDRRIRKCTANIDTRIFRHEFFLLNHRYEASVFQTISAGSPHFLSERVRGRHVRNIGLLRVINNDSVHIPCVCFCDPPLPHAVCDEVRIAVERISIAASA